MNYRAWHKNALPRRTRTRTGGHGAKGRRPACAADRLTRPDSERCANERTATVVRASLRFRSRASRCDAVDLDFKTLLFKGFFSVLRSALRSSVTSVVKVFGDVFDGGLHVESIDKSRR